MPLADVSDTARWVAYFRATESERTDALFRDPFARRLAGERGRAIAEGLPKGPLAWSLTVRTRVFDELILSAVRTGDVRTVVNLAAGLDTRPYRLALPPGLRWVEVDLPGIIAHKDEALRGERPSCGVERISLDLASRRERQAFLASAFAGTPAQRVLVVTEGLLVYLAETEVAALADDLRRALPTAWWLLENVSPAILARQRRTWDKALRGANAEHKFAPANGLEFFRSHGWSPRETRSLLDEAERLRRELPAVALLRRVSRLVPFLGRAYARRHARFRDAMLYAVMEAAPPPS